MDPAVAGLVGERSGWTVHASPGAAYMRELHRLESQTLVYRERIAVETTQRAELEERHLQARREFTRCQTATRNGFAVKEDDAEFRKAINRLETQLESLNVKNSTASKANRDTKKKIEDLRKSKLMNLKIAADLGKEVRESRRLIEAAVAEIASINDQRHRIKNEIATAKRQMATVIEEFAEEVSVAKDSIEGAQQGVMGTIQERIKVASSMPSRGRLIASSRSGVSAKEVKAKMHAQTLDIAVADTARILTESGATSIDEFLCALEASETEIFELYQTILDKDRQKARLESANKGLALSRAACESRMEALRSYKAQKRRVLEGGMRGVAEAIARHQEEYSVRLAQLKTVTDDLMHLLKNVCACSGYACANAA